MGKSSSGDKMGPVRCFAHTFFRAHQSFRSSPSNISACPFLFFDNFSLHPYTMECTFKNPKIPLDFFGDTFPDASNPILC